MFKFYKMLFFLTMIMGTLITVSSYSWLSMWMGLEINLLSIIPLLNNKNNLYPSEASLKYFITQVFASSILLLSIILKLNLSEFNFPNSLTLILNSALLIKLGAAPFHAWFPEVMDGLNWFSGALILTWQKIAPMVIIINSPLITKFLFIIIIISTIFSGMIGINQISLRKIMAYSSINHISWMLSSTLNNQLIWLVYFMIYSIITFNIILILHKMKVFFINQLSNSLNKQKMIKFFFIMNFLSLGGLPPFLGFFPKWLVINNLVINNFYLLSVMLISITLITLFFYLRISFSILMINSNEPIIHQNKNFLNNFWIMTLNFIALISLLTCTLIFNFI